MGSIPTPGSEVMPVLRAPRSAGLPIQPRHRAAHVLRVRPVPAEVVSLDLPERHVAVSVGPSLDPAPEISIVPLRGERQNRSLRAFSLRLNSALLFLGSQICLFNVLVLEDDIGETDHICDRRVARGSLDQTGLRQSGGQGASSRFAVCVDEAALICLTLGHSTRISQRLSRVSLRVVDQDGPEAEFSCHSRSFVQEAGIPQDKPPSVEHQQRRSLCRRGRGSRTENQQAAEKQHCHPSAWSAAVPHPR